MIRSTPLRLAAAFATLFVIGSLASNLIALRVVDAELGGLRDSRLKDRYAALESIHAEEGLDGLVENIDAFDRRVGDRSDIALLFDRDGTLLAGIDAAPLFGRVPDVGWSTVASTGARSDREHDSRALAGSLDGRRLVVAASGHDSAEVSEIMLGGFAWGTLVMLALAVGGAAQFATAFRVRFAALRDTMHDVADGELAARVPLSGRDDDIDALGRDVNEALQRLERAMGQVRQASTDIAHDLRTPLSRLRIALEKAVEEDRAGRSVTVTLDEALGTCDGLSGTFTALLRIARLETGARRAAFAVVDVHAVVRRVVDLYEDVAEDAGRSVELLAGGEHDARIDGDEALLVQLFSNLIENALQHSPPGSRVECAVATSGGRIVATVADDGPGVPEQERENVLRRLYRMDSSRTTPGSGLGLSLIKAVADLHEATLALEDNAPGLRVRVSFARRFSDSSLRIWPS